MVKFEIKKEYNDPIVRLYLEEADGEVYIYAENDDDGWIIGKFTTDGCLLLEDCYDVATGLQLDEKGRIIIRY